jgi:hypothetical protein
MKNPAFQITSEEKAFALDHLARSRDHFIKTIADINETQWYLRPGAGEWSAAECADHLLQTELYFFMPTVQKMLSEPADPEKRSEAAGKDQMVVESMEKRAMKIKGQPWEEKSEYIVDKEALVQNFLKERNAFISYLESSDDEFRAHFTFFPGMETIDVYQFILFISAHTNRHTDQISDIKKLDFYPAG